jgi:hypothetical protein
MWEKEKKRQRMRRRKRRRRVRRSLYCDQKSNDDNKR